MQSLAQNPIYRSQFHFCRQLLCPLTVKPAKAGLLDGVRGLCPFCFLGPSDDGVFPYLKGFQLTIKESFTPLFDKSGYGMKG